MGWTKQQLVEEAYVELAKSGDVFDLTPGELQTGLRRLDAMMATWNGKGIRLGYPLPSSPEGSDLDAESNLPDAAVETVYLNLAVRLAPSFGKQLSPDTRSNARMGYEVLLSRAAMPQEMQLPGSMPRGAGNKPWRSSQTFVTDPTEPLTAGANDAIHFT